MSIAGFRSQAWKFIKLTRVLFLLGGFLLYALGGAAAFRRGIAINWGGYLLGQVVVTSIQLMAHYANEYYDQEVDRRSAETRTWFSGGSGILPAGGISPPIVLAAAHICAAAAVLTGILVSVISPWMFPIILFSFLGSWFYSAPPISLMSSGYGELTTSIIVALLLPLAGYSMQGGFPPVDLWLACAPLVPIHVAMMIAFEFPDRSADQSVGKKTLVVRLGFQGAAWVVNVLIAGACLIIVFSSMFTKFPGWWMGLTFPVAVWQMAAVHRAIHLPTRTQYRILTTGGVGLFSLMSLLALFGFFFSG